jgi:hypothetical protein
LANFTVLLANKKPHVGLVKAFWWAGFFATMLIVINNEPGRGWGIRGEYGLYVEYTKSIHDNVLDIKIAKKK